MTDRERVLEWLKFIGETDPDVIGEVLETCRNDKEARKFFVMQSEEIPKPDSFGDRVAHIRDLALAQKMKRHSGKRDGKLLASGE
jgi:hypothetical protein